MKVAEPTPGVDRAPMKDGTGANLRARVGNTRRAALIAVASVALLGGCGPASHQDLVDWMAEQGKGARGHLDPIPQIKPYEPFVYNDFDLPDPFKPRKIEPVKSDNANKLAPDLNRRKEPLEAYPLESLAMVGTLEKGRTRYALVKTPERDIYQVRQGMHMGQNYGVITDISDSDIKLKELMQDGSGDWSERSSTLNLLQADQKQEQK
jgi:type IV pilus assembly protein PilP